MLSLTTKCVVTFILMTAMMTHPNVNIVTQGDITIGSPVFGKDIHFDTRNSINVTATVGGEERVGLRGAALTGNGTIRGRQIYIHVRKFAFTGTIACDDMCFITTEDPFDQKMFKRSGKGTFIFHETEKAFYVSPSGLAFYEKVDSTNYAGETALMIAASENDIQGIQRLISNGANVNVRNNKGCSAIFYATNKDSNIDVVKMLVQHGAEVSIDHDGYTPLMQAVDNDLLDIAVFLIKQGADVNAVNGDVPVLLGAIDQGSVPLVKVLLEHGANPNFHEPESGTTLLMRAIQRGFFDIVKLLVEYGADVNAKENISSATPLIIASHYGLLDITQFLVERGADVNATTKQGLSAIDVAKKESIKSFLQKLPKSSSNGRFSLSQAQSFRLRMTAVAGIIIAYIYFGIKYAGRGQQSR